MVSTSTEERADTGPNEIVPRLASEIARLDAGSAAALRRGPLAGSGAAAFWKLIAGHEPGLRGADAWAPVVQAIAILTGVGRSAADSPESAHDPRHPMGAALFGAGLSELRLARLLASRGDLRHELLLRTCRRLARDPQHRRFDLRTLAWFTVHRGEETDRRIARDYYRAQVAADATDSHSTEA